MSEAEARPTNFIRQIIDEDLATGKHTTVHTRFPPEPNGYLHIGHAKSICLNFGIAQDYQGQCNLRFDDTNPVKEDIEYVESIKNDVQWLGFHWSGDVCYSSDYFDQLHQYAVELINKGLAYVDELSADEIREYRGSLKAPGKNSPYRDRSVEENLALFEKMRAGGFEEGKPACVQKSIWPRRLSSCAIRCCTALNLPIIIRPAASGASIRCTTSRTALAMRWKALRTPCVPWSSRTTVACMTGCWTTSASRFTRVSTNSRV
jgi:glutaminyl-tRNA synthetase